MKAGHLGIWPRKTRKTRDLTEGTEGPKGPQRQKEDSCSHAVEGAAAVLLGFGSVSAFAEASPKRQNPSLPHGHSIF
jgi:hypothetical protein